MIGRSDSDLRDRRAETTLPVAHWLGGHYMVAAAVTYMPLHGGSGILDANTW